MILLNSVRISTIEKNVRLDLLANAPPIHEYV